MSKFTARHLDWLYTALAARGLAPATIRQVHALMRAALNQAVGLGQEMAGKACDPQLDGRVAIGAGRAESGFEPQHELGARP